MAARKAILLMNSRKHVKINLNTFKKETNIHQKETCFSKKNMYLSKRDLCSSTSEPGIAARQARLMAPVPVKAWWYTRAGVVTAARRSTSFWATIVPSVVVYCAWRDSFMCLAVCCNMLQTLQFNLQRSCRKRSTSLWATVVPSVVVYCDITHSCVCVAWHDSCVSTWATTVVATVVVYCVWHDSFMCLCVV